MNNGLKAIIQTEGRESNIQNNDNETHKKQNHTEDNEKQESASIFSQEEIRSTVKAFVLAWLRGDVKIVFPSVDEFMTRGRLAKESVDYKQAYAREIKTKSALIDLISICAGSKEATSEERKKAIAKLFTMIFFMRAASGRLEGRFTEFDVEERLSRLEEKLNATEDIVNQIAILIRGIEHK